MREARQEAAQARRPVRTPVRPALRVQLVACSRWRSVPWRECQKFRVWRPNWREPLHSPPNRIDLTPPKWNCNRNFHPTPRRAPRPARERSAAICLRNP